MLADGAQNATCDTAYVVIPDNLRRCPRQEHDQNPGAIPYRRKGRHHRKQGQITPPHLLRSCKESASGINEG